MGDFSDTTDGQCPPPSPKEPIKLKQETYSCYCIDACV